MTQNTEPDGGVERNNAKTGFLDDTGTFYPSMESVRKYLPEGRTIEPSADPLVKKREALQAGYTFHPANDSTQGWAFCIDGDYSKEFPEEVLAWDAALKDLESRKLLSNSN